MSDAAASSSSAFGADPLSLAARIEKQADEFLDALNERIARLPEELFHYTDATALLGILHGGTIWATHYKFLNDFKEIRYGLEVASSVIAEHMRAGQLPPLMRAVLERVTASREEMQEFGGFEFDVYLTSFSELGDLLSQWRGYAETGAGFSIGLKPHALSRDRLPVSPYTRLMLVQLLYEPAEQRRLVSEAIESILAPLSEVVPTANSGEADGFEVVETAAFRLNQAIVHLALMFKAPGFAEEREWRAISVRVLSGIKVSDDVRLRVSKNRLIPYVEIPLTLTAGRMPVSRIVCGPRQDFDQARLAVKIALRQAGYVGDHRVNVVQSATALR